MTAKPPGPLLAMRDALTACDLQIVHLLGERMRLIRRVAELKAQARLPSFDREREGALLDDLLAKAAEIDVPADIVRDVYAALLAASRAAQRRVLHAGETHFSIGILGGTSGMGAFLARVLDGAGYPVETTGLDRGAPSAEVASRHDLVIVAVPIGQTVRVIEEVAPHVRRGACIADVTSVKVEPMRAMLAHAREDVDVVGTHPIFGPNGSDMDRQRVVLVRGRGESGFSRVKHLYESFGAEVIEATAEEHDAGIAAEQHRPGVSRCGVPRVGHRARGLTGAPAATRRGARRRESQTEERMSGGQTRKATRATGKEGRHGSPQEHTVGQV